MKIYDFKKHVPQKDNRFIAFFGDGSGANIYWRNEGGDYYNWKGCQIVDFNRHILESGYAKFAYMSDNDLGEKMTIINKNTKFSQVCELRNDTVKPTWKTLEFAVSEPMLQEEMRELIMAIITKNKIETLDGAYDVSVIALNIAYNLFRMEGFTHEEATQKTEQGFHRVLDSNLSKIKENGTVEYKENGKVAKPDTFLNPYFEDLLTQNELF